MRVAVTAGLEIDAKKYSARPVITPAAIAPSKAMAVPVFAFVITMKIVIPRRRCEVPAVRRLMIAIFVMAVFPAVVVVVLR